MRATRHAYIVSLAASFAVLLTALAALVAPSAALAHADLLSSQPVPGADLAVAPARVLLTFSEAVDVPLSGIRVYDQHGNAVPQQTAQPAPGVPFGMAVRFTQPLPAGLYTVEWRAIAQDDGHATAGVYSFGVRRTPLSAQARSLNGTTTGQAVASITGRWLLYVGLIVLTGAALTGWVALGGRVSERGQWLLRGAWLVAAAGLLTSMLAEQAITRAPSLLPLFLTPVGAALANEGKALIACGAALVVLFFWPHRVPLALVSAAAAVTMLFHVLAGHADAATTLRAFEVLDQWVHMLGVGVWVGGLAWLLLGLRDEPGLERAQAVRRFSTIAGIALGAVLLTGLVRAFGEVGSVSRLFTTAYGAILLVKLALVAVLVALGALNRYRMVPALSRDARALRPFGFTSRGELAVACCILAATAVLSGLAPAFVH